MEGIELPPPPTPTHSQIIYETREMNISTHWKLKLQSVFRFRFSVVIFVAGTDLIFTTVYFPTF